MAARTIATIAQGLLSATQTSAAAALLPTEGMIHASCDTSGRLAANNPAVTLRLDVSFDNWRSFTSLTGTADEGMRNDTLKGQPNTTTTITANVVPGSGAQARMSLSCAAPLLTSASLSAAAPAAAA